MTIILHNNINTQNTHIYTHIYTLYKSSVKKTHAYNYKV